MGRTVKEAPLSSPSARAKLKARAKPYFRAIDAGLHIGYRKGKQAGVWVGRRAVDGGEYEVATLAKADDNQEADGLSILSFSQAQAKVSAWARGANSADQAAAAGAPATVADAVVRYLDGREERNDERGVATGSKKDARYRLARYVLFDRAKVEAAAKLFRKSASKLSAEDLSGCESSLAQKSLQDLTAGDLSAWRKGLKSLAPSSVARTANDFKAALNNAAMDFREQLPERFAQQVKDGLRSIGAPSIVARPPQVLTDTDVRALIDAAGDVDAAGEWGGDLRRMIVVLAATGARFSQVARIKVAGLQPSLGRLMVPVSRKGRGAKAAGEIAVRIGDDVFAALEVVRAGRASTETLLIRPRWRQIGPAEWVVDGRAAWENPSELSRPWAEIRRKAGLAPDVVPYALRHSSIVRGLRANLPVRLVAALHDTSSAMIERHYAAYIVDALDELAARAVVPLITAPAERPSFVNRAAT